MGLFLMTMVELIRHLGVYNRVHSEEKDEQHLGNQTVVSTGQIEAR